MKVLIDTNIVLDYLLRREEFIEDSAELFQAIDSNRIVGYVTATTLTDIFYIARKHTRSIEQARQVVSDILIVMEICPVNRTTLESALASGIADFEDAVQYFSALQADCSIIITRNEKDFKYSSLPIMTAEEYLSSISGSNLS